MLVLIESEREYEAQDEDEEKVEDQNEGRVVESFTM